MTVKELKEALNLVLDETMLVCIGYEGFVISEASVVTVNNTDTSIIQQGLGEVFVIYED